VAWKKISGGLITAPACVSVSHPLLRAATEAR
jgi:hypothetical protein